MSEIVFFENHAENEVGRLVPDFFLFFKELYIRWKQVLSTLVLIYFVRPWHGLSIKKLYNISDSWSRDILNLDYFQKGLGLASPPHFVYDFLRKIFLVLSLNWPIFHVWLPLLLDIMGNICIVIICCPVCDVIIFEINQSLLSSRFFT